MFSGIDYLRYVDDAARAAQRAARERAASAPDAAPRAGVAPPTDGAPTTAPTAATIPPPAGGTPAAPPAPSLPPQAAPDAAPFTGPATASAPTAPPAPPPPVPPAPQRAAEPDPDRDAPAHALAPARPDEPATPPGSYRDATTATEDAWTVAAHVAHERSLRDDLPPGDLGASTGHHPGTPGPDVPGALPRDAADTRGASLQDAPSQDALLPQDARLPQDAPLPQDALQPRDAPPPQHAPARAPVATRSPGALPALPAPEAPRVPLDELLARPAVPWPPASGPQTVIAADDDLKTAFFLTDSSFGPLPGEASDVMPPTSIHRPGAHPETVTRVHGGPPPAAPAAERPPPAPGAPPGLPLRPERGAVDDDDPLLAPSEAPVFAAPPPTPFVPAPRPADLAPPEAAVDYFPRPRRRSRSLGLALSPTAWIAAVALSSLLALQALVGWRDAIAARVPAVAPALAAVLGPFGLEIAPPREIDALTIEGFELQASGTPNVLNLSAVLRNRGGHAVGYPAMELTLTDGGGGLLVRKVIPAELYVGDAALAATGLAARSERPLRLSLQHDGLQPTGFSVALFYP